MTLVVGAGSNLGAREASIRAAALLLDARGGISVRGVSKIYETEPLGPPQPAYLNAAFRLDTSLPPLEVLSILLRTERRLGRHRDPDARWGPRSIDLDLLWDERGTHESSELRVPHSELEKRSFALAPLLDVAPELRDRFGRTLEAVGGPPAQWKRAAIIDSQRHSTGFRVDVEADSVAEACALCVGQLPLRCRAWSTRHLCVEPSSAAFSNALRDLFRSGFSAQSATISHCSKAQWTLEFHGVNLGMPVAMDVRLQTTSGAQREVHAQLEVPGTAA